MEIIRWGIIGCGNVTEVKSGPALQKACHSQLTAVMRRNGQLAKDYAIRHNVKRWYTDADQLINDPDVDAVYIATPPAYHHQYTLQCAYAKKPVYVEKPMAVNYKQCQEMVQACQEAQVALFVAYYRRALPKFLKIKELLAKGVIGEIRCVAIKNYQQARLSADAKDLPWRVKPEISGGGLFLDIGSHTLDIFDFLVGPIVEVSGCSANLAKLYTPEDTVSASFAFASGVIGTGIWNFSAFENFDRNEIIGSEGKLRFSTFGSEPIHVTTKSGLTEVSVQTPAHIQQPLIQSIVDQLLGGKPAPSTGETAARTNWVMDQILATK